MAQGQNAVIHPGSPGGPEGRIVMGCVLAPFGIKGWLKIEPWSEQPEQLLAYSEWWLGRSGSWRSVKVLECAQHGAFLIARLEGCADRDAAMAWRGCEVALPRQVLPVAAKDEYYQADLIGLEVVNLRGEHLGLVAGLFSNGAHDVLRVAPEATAGQGYSVERKAGAADERLVPWIATVVRAVDVAGRRIEVDWELDW